MSEPAKSALFAVAIVVMAAGGFWINGTMDADKGAFVVSARGVEKVSRAGMERGEYGGDLGFLRRFHVGPQSSAESNHYFDLWSPGALPALACFNGLTNNRALIVDSHGSAGFRWHGRGYGLYPRETLLQRGQETPGFSPADFARVLGREQAAAIHNIVIAGCNEEGRFRSQEWRRHFVNATNITHMTPGKLAYKPMFYQAIVTFSFEIKPLFGRGSRGFGSACSVEREPSSGAEPLGAYVADLYLPGARRPYRTQRAGRELLEPEHAAATVLRVDRASSDARL
jgi:hypothetical protein